MPTPSFDLTKLDTNTFEHMVNMLALKVLGSGHTGFGPGADGGRDGFFEGVAAYPSEKEAWRGTWYIQSKFHAPHLSTDPQKWLINRAKEEIETFKDHASDRVWPNNWILASNIEPSGASVTGAFDRIQGMVRKARPSLAKHFHIWGGRKILDLLAEHPSVAEYYAEFVTPGNVLSTMYREIRNSSAKINEVVRYLVVTQFSDQQYTRLEQAGSRSDNRPGIHMLFTDLPFVCRKQQRSGLAVETMAKALSQKHTINNFAPDVAEWKMWQRDPCRTRIWFIKGGPGQGKSTLTQYVSQIQRAALLLSDDGETITPVQRTLAEDVRMVATRHGLWPIAPRIPVTVELKSFAQWIGTRDSGASSRLIAFLTETISIELGDVVKAGTLKDAFRSGKWMFVFDGLDEVPGDVKDAVAAQVSHFVDDFLVGCKADAFTICTSRPQGYSGQFDQLAAADIELTPLSKDQALQCATPLLKLERSSAESRVYIATLNEALNSPAIAEIMTTPLQSHIMAVIVRDGGKPPDRKWQLFSAFYDIIKKREANRNLPDAKLAKLLREGDTLLKALHNRLGFELHARAEVSGGATTSLRRDDLRKIVAEVVSALQDGEIEETVATLMEATTDRLVLVSTPESGDHVRFDIRPLQEFFAAEQIYESAEPASLAERVKIIAGDSHWREVMHFLLSALVENSRRSELSSVVSVLAELDDGDSPPSRALARRLALGGIITARVLAEGVLEQDKRVRTLFGGSLSALLGCYDADDYLLAVKAPHSLYWLRDILLSCLKEQGDSEKLGAAITLARILGDTDSSSLIAKNLISECPLAFRLMFCEILAESEPPSLLKLPRWVADIALDIILAPKWVQAGGGGIECAIRVLTKAQFDAAGIAARYNIAAVVAAQIPKLLSEDTPRGSQDRRPATMKRDRFGIFTEESYAPDDELVWQRWTDNFWAELSSCTGILKTVFLVFSFLKRPSERGIRLLVESIDGDPDNIYLLPRSILSFLDIGKRANWFEQALKDPTSIIRTENPGYHGIILRFEVEEPGASGKVKPDYQALIQEMPIIALHLLEPQVGVKREKLEQLIRDARQIKAIVDGLDPRWSVGWILRNVGHYYKVSDKLGDALVSFTSKHASEAVLSAAFGSEIRPFRLNLSRHAVLLPHILGLFLSASSRYIGESRSVSKRARVSELVGEYVLSVEEFGPILMDDTLPKRVQAAAVVFRSFHPDSPPGVLPDFVRWYDERESHWYLPSVALLLDDLIKSGDESACCSMSALLDRARVDFKARSGLAPIIRGWRERAFGPVNRHGDSSLWV